MEPLRARHVSSLILLLVTLWPDSTSCSDSNASTAATTTIGSIRATSATTSEATVRLIAEPPEINETTTTTVTSEPKKKETDNWRDLLNKAKPKPFSSGGVLPPQTYLNRNLHKAPHQVLLAQAIAASSSSPGLTYGDRNSNFGPTSDSCDNIHLHEPQGTIRSPGYPKHFDSNNLTSCTWYIVGGPRDIITISFDDIDLPSARSRRLCVQKKDTNQTNNKKNNGTIESQDCSCSQSWITITNTESSRHERTFCGSLESDNKLTFQPFISDSNHVTIKFFRHLPNSSGDGPLASRGFHLTYLMGPVQSAQCKMSEFQCRSGKCIPGAWKCNRRDECGDGSDETLCDDLCAGITEVRCDSLGGDRSVPGCYSFPLQRCNGVWNCENGADEKGCGGCPATMFSCPTGGNCYSEAKRCDANADCIDYSDELNCGFCGPNKTQCSPNSLTHCFDPFTERCNHQLNCVGGEDEKGCLHGCENKILCLSGTGCYAPEERCNGIPDCSDYSDEKNCTLDICRADHGSFLCGDGRCIRVAWLCDRSRDCEDSSDEMNCLKNSVITAAIMGSLICGLLLVIAISCTCKLIALRQVEQQQQFGDSHGGEPRSHGQGYSSRSFPFGLNGDSTDTPLFRLEHEFFYREPPPSYAAAVGATCEASTTPYDRERQCRRQQRRMRRHRRRPPSPPALQTDEGEVVDPSNLQTGRNVVVGSVIGTGVGSRCVVAHVQTGLAPLISTSHNEIVDSPSSNESTHSGDGSKTTTSAATVEEVAVAKAASVGDHHQRSKPPGGQGISPETTTTSNNSSSSSSSVIVSPRLPSDVSIELDSIPSPSLMIDCDEQPLLS